MTRTEGILEGILEGFNAAGATCLGDDDDEEVTDLDKKETVLVIADAEDEDGIKGVSEVSCFEGESGNREARIKGGKSTNNDCCLSLTLATVVDLFAAAAAAADDDDDDDDEVALATNFNLSVFEGFLVPP